MTHVTGRRALLQSAAAALGSAMLAGIADTTSSQAQTANFMIFWLRTSSNAARPTVCAMIEKRSGFQTLH
jgi:hypothetical protein